MKKNRPGVKLSLLCSAAQVEAMEAIIFQETTTLGVRRWVADRHVLPRQSHQVETPWGPVEGKIAWLAAESARFVPEFESCRRIAEEQHLPLAEVYGRAQAAFRPGEVKRIQPGG